ESAVMIPLTLVSTLSPYTTLFRSITISSEALRCREVLLRVTVREMQYVRWKRSLLKHFLLVLTTNSRFFPCKRNSLDQRPYRSLPFVFYMFSSCWPSYTKVGRCHILFYYTSLRSYLLLF